MENDWNPVERASLLELLELKAEQLSEYINITPDQAATFILVKIMIEEQDKRNANGS